jgi:hypothetical protein
MLQRAVLSHPTPLLTPMDPPQEIGHHSHRLIPSQTAHGAPVLQQVLGRADSLEASASVAVQADGDLVQAVHSVVPTGEALDHGPPAVLGLLAHGLLGKYF